MNKFTDFAFKLVDDNVCSYLIDLKKYVLLSAVDSNFVFKVF